MWEGPERPDRGTEAAPTFKSRRIARSCGFLFGDRPIFSLKTIKTTADYTDLYGSEKIPRQRSSGFKIGPSLLALDSLSICDIRVIRGQSLIPEHLRSLPKSRKLLTSWVSI